MVFPITPFLQPNHLNGIEDDNLCMIYVWLTSTNRNLLSNERQFSIFLLVVRTVKDIHILLYTLL